MADVAAGVSVRLSTREKLGTGFLCVLMAIRVLISRSVAGVDIPVLLEFLGNVVCMVVCRACGTRHRRASQTVVECGRIPHTPMHDSGTRFDGVLV